MDSPFFNLSNIAKTPQQQHENKNDEPSLADLVNEINLDPQQYMPRDILNEAFTNIEETKDGQDE